jgi:hypothetical protein
MPLNMDLTSIQQNLKADMMYLRNFIDWCNARYQSYNQSLTTSVMNTAGISAGDQSIILQFISDLHMINLITSNTLPGSASNVTFNIDNYLGLL